MAEKISIPRTINQATKALTGLDRLLTARTWERAAIVYAFTHDGRRTEGKTSLSFQEFSRLGIAGLTDRQVVAEYRARWQAAIDDGHAVECGPGDEVRLPTVPWRTTRTGTNGYNTVEGAQATVQRIIERHGPEVVARTVVDNPEATEAVVERTVAKRPEIVARHARPAIEAENREAFRQLREGRAEPDPTRAARNMLGGRRPFMEAWAALNQIRTGTRLLGQLREDLPADERGEIIEGIEDSARYLGMVLDVYRSKSSLDEELAAFLAGTDD